MSTIYSDAAGNKYLGDCRWGNHDINYPTTNFLKAVDNRTLRTTFLEDMLSLFTNAGWENINVPQTWGASINATIFSATVPGESAANYFRWATNANLPNNMAEAQHIGSGWTEPSFTTQGYSLYSSNFDYSLCVGSQSISFVPFLYVPSGYSSSVIRPRFYYWGRLLDVNTNFNYYSASFINKCVMISALSSSTTLSLIAPTVSQHYIAGTKKSLLQTGRAAYAISCSDGQTPGTQWATDMWVYDNNATLGYPVIGRVPNMLLGVGTYTYLKPVKIQGSVFPDGGSPWYLPVGTFAGKVLLMRCYSSMT